MILTILEDLQKPSQHLLQTVHKFFNKGFFNMELYEVNNKPHGALIFSSLILYLFTNDFLSSCFTMLKLTLYLSNFA